MRIATPAEKLVDAIPHPGEKVTKHDAFHYKALGFSAGISILTRGQHDEIELAIRGLIATPSLEHDDIYTGSWSTSPYPAPSPIKFWEPQNRLPLHKQRC